jgi:hypothetical protein
MNTKIFIPVFVILAVLLGACGINVDLDLARGSGKVTTETRQVSNFDRLVLSGIGDVTILQGDKESLEIEAEDNVLPHILAKVEDGTLHISFDRKTVVPTKPIKFTLSMRDVRGLETQGVSNISADAIKTDRLKLGISGTGNIHIRDLQAERVDSSVSGAGSLEIEGRVDTQVVNMSGAGNYDGEDLESKTADVTITGLGKVVIWATSDLSVVISGTGGVDYYGSPQVVQQISGLGRLKHMGNK